LIYLAGVVACVLLAIGLIHFLWGLRIFWPLGDEQALARAAVGARGIVAMPPSYQSHLVALAMIIAAADALLLVELPSYLPGWLVLAVGSGCCFVFVARGVAGYVPVWARITPEQPFRMFDKRYYSPLCVALGTGFAVLVISG